MITTEQRQRFSAALDRLAGDEFVFLKVAEIAKSDGSALIEESKEHLMAGNFHAAVKSIHKAKGLLATFVDDVASLGLDEVMTIASKNDADAALNAFKSIEPDLGKLLYEIDALPCPA